MKILIRPLGNFSMLSSVESAALCPAFHGEKSGRSPSNRLFRLWHPSSPLMYRGRCLDVLLDGFKRNSRCFCWGANLNAVSIVLWLFVCVCVALPVSCVLWRGVIFCFSSVFHQGLSGVTGEPLRRSTITCPISWHCRELRSGRDRDIDGRTSTRNSP